MSRPIRFLQVTTFYPPHHFGGDAMYVYRLAHALGDRGHHVDVVHCVDSYRLLAGRKSTMRLPEHPNVSVHSLQSGLGRLSPLLSQQTGQPVLKRRAITDVLGRSMDVVHFHNTSLFGPGVLALDPPPTGHPAPVKLYTTHEYWLVCPTHLLWKNGTRLCEQPTCFSCTLAAGRPPQLWRYTDLMARSARHVDRFLAPSRFAIRMHAERGFTQPLMHLPPCAPRADSDWQNPGARPHPRPYFLYVGRLESIKGTAALVRSWREIGDADLLVVGDGADRARVEAETADNPRVVVCGQRAPHELGRYYAHALACIVPSVTYEVAPMVVLEAFARKTPLIARDLGGTAELVRESDGGLLYTTEPELRKAVTRLANDDRLRRSLGERGYVTFAERWTEEAHLAAYLAIVDDVAAAKHGHVPWRTPA
jgi:glycosyltransferase involved in cell wall biosynthesis